jgi:hypothetical protein
VHVLVEAVAVEAEELLHQQGQLVRRAVGVGGETPVVDELRAPTGVLVEADDRLRVAAVHDEEHG